MGEEKKAPLECAVTLMAEIAEERDMYRKMWSDEQTEKWKFKRELEELKKQLEELKQDV